MCVHREVTLTYIQKPPQMFFLNWQVERGAMRAKKVQSHGRKSKREAPLHVEIVVCMSFCMKNIFTFLFFAYF